MTQAWLTLGSYYRYAPRLFPICPNFDKELAKYLEVLAVVDSWVELISPLVSCKSHLDFINKILL